MNGRASMGVEMQMSNKDGWIAGTVVALAAFALPSAAGAQSYNLTVSSGTLTSISSSGTVIPEASGDDAVGAFAPGFAFPFFGTMTSPSVMLYPSTNGLLGVDESSSSYSNDVLPSSASPNSFIAPMWDDLQIVSGVSAVYYQIQGSTGSRVIVVEWYNIATLASSTETLTMQVRIYEASGNIEIYYGNRATASGWAGTIGVENYDGSVGFAHGCFSAGACTTDDVPSGTKLVFVPSSTPPPTTCDLMFSYMDGVPSSVNAGDSVSLTFEIYNAGPNTSGPTELAVFAGAFSTVTTSDLYLTSISIPSIASGSYHYDALTMSVPSGISGGYYVAAFVDPWGVVSESSESNNRFDLGYTTVGGGGGDTITVTTQTLPNATAGQSYFAQLQQAGGTSPSWRLSSGSLPSGLSLSASGAITGSALSPGSSSFVVEASQSGYTPGYAELSLTVDGTSNGPRITTAELPAATVGVAYSATINVTGGLPPYAVQVLGERPEWLSVDSGTGALSGTPSSAGSYELLVSVFDSESRDASATLVLVVEGPSVFALVESVPAAVVGQPYTAVLARGGQAPYTGSVTEGMLPPGLTLVGATLSGTINQEGSWTFSVSITDNTGASATGQWTLGASTQQELRITLASEIQLNISGSVMFQLTAEGGVAPYTWSIVSGELPAGLSLDAGRIVGQASAVSSTTVTFAVSDSVGARAEATVTVRAVATRPPSSGGRGGSGRDSGCTCLATSEARPGPSVLLLGLLGFVLVLPVLRPRSRSPRV